LERQKWFESSPYAVLPYTNSDKTEWKFALHRFDEEFKAEKDIFGLIIGDYVHALRSALDQLVWQLVTVANGITPKSDNEVSFPIITTHPSKFWARPMINRNELTFEQALFLEGFQPYRAIDAADKNALADLHALWNADKHKLVTPVRVTLSKEGPVFRTNAEAGNIVSKEWDSEVALEGDAEIAWVTVAPVGPDPQVDVTSLPVDVTFGEGGRLIQDLPTLLFITDQIVENCARFFE
jgi:hypothetical protein